MTHATGLPRIPPSGAALLAPFSVLMSTYHGESPDNLRLALSSCLEQTLPPRQIVLVLDGPVGQLQEAVIATAAQRALELNITLTLHRITRQGGLAAALNAGLTECQCEYVARMDSDDCSAANRFDVQWGFLERHPDVDLVGAWQAEFETTPDQVLRVKTMPAEHSAIVRQLQWRNVISHPSIVIRKALVVRLGGYRSLRFLEDYDLFMRVVEAGGLLHGIQEPLVLVRVTPGQRHRRGGVRYALEELKLRWELFRRRQIRPQVLLVSGVGYLAFRLTPAWVKKGLYSFVRQRPRAATKSMGAVLAEAVDDDLSRTPGRPLRLAAMHAAAGALWKVRRQRPATAGHIPVLCYHRVLPGYYESDGPVYSVEPDRFAAHMGTLVHDGFRTLSLREYAAIANGEAPIPELAVLVTFDDGFADFIQFAQPIAASEGATLNLFLCTGLPAAESPEVYGEVSSQMVRHRKLHPGLWRGLTWSELRQLEHTTSLGFHSHRHGNFGRHSKEEIEEDIMRGLGYWRGQLEGVPTTFAFPMGGHGNCPKSAISALREHGFSLLFSTRLGRTRLPTKASVLQRIVIHQQDDVETLRRKLHGAYDWLGGLRGLDQALRSALAS